MVECFPENNTPMSEDKRKSTEETCQQPIYVPCDKPYRVFWSDREKPICSELGRILLDDDKDEFVKTINRLKSADEVPKDTLVTMFELGAVNCTSAVLNGETSRIFDVNSTFYDESKGSPLYKAAYTSSPKIIKLLLDKGANPDIRCGYIRSAMKPMLPLDIALHNRRKRLEAVRLLAEKMEQLPEEVSCYVKESKFVELAVLLMVARKRVLSSTIAPEIGCRREMEIRSFVLPEIAWLNVKLFSATACSKLRKEYRDRKAKMEETLLLLEIFERVGDALDEYLRIDRPNCSERQLASELARLFEGSGYNVKGELEDDMNRASSDTELFILSIVKDKPSPFNQFSRLTHIPSGRCARWDPRKHEAFPKKGFLDLHRVGRVRWFCTLPSSSKTNNRYEPANQMKKMGNASMNLHFSIKYLLLL